MNKPPLAVAECGCPLNSMPTIIEAECGCRFKVVSNLLVLTTGALELDAICLLHSNERTKYLEQKERDA